MERLRLRYACCRRLSSGSMRSRSGLLGRFARGRRCALWSIMRPRQTGDGVQGRRGILVLDGLFTRSGLRLVGRSTDVLADQGDGHDDVPPARRTRTSTASTISSSAGAWFRGRGSVSRAPPPLSCPLRPDAQPASVDDTCQSSPRKGKESVVWRFGLCVCVCAVAMSLAMQLAQLQSSVKGAALALEASGWCSSESTLVGSTLSDRDALPTDSAGERIVAIQRRT